MTAPDNISAQFGGQRRKLSPEERIDHDVAEGVSKRLTDDEAERQYRKLKAGQAPPVQIRGGGWLSQQQFAPVAWAVPGLVPEGVTFLAGAPKSGKSWLVLSAALAMAGGTQILGALDGMPARPVLYMALEDSDRRMKERCGLLGCLQIPELFEYATRATPDQTLETAWEWLVRNTGRRAVCIIDTWGKIAPAAERGETTYDRDYRLGTRLGQLCLAGPGTSVIVNHHTRKQGSGDFIDTVSGTQGVAGSADTIMVLARDRGADAATLRVTGRDVIEDDYALAGFPFWKLDGGSLSVAAGRARASAERQNLGDRSTELLDLITATGQLSTAEAAKALEVSSDTASAYLSRLAGSGKIQRISRGVYMSLVPTVGSVRSVGSWEADANTPNTPNGGYESAWSQLYSTADHEAARLQTRLP